MWHSPHNSTACAKTSLCISLQFWNQTLECIHSNSISSTVILGLLLCHLHSPNWKTPLHGNPHAVLFIPQILLEYYYITYSTTYTTTNCAF